MVPTDINAALSTHEEKLSLVTSGTVDCIVRKRIQENSEKKC